MMNILALALVVTSLAAAGVLSPAPERAKNDDEVILKEGRRVVVVEYEKQGIGNTKVSILSQYADEVPALERRNPLSDASYNAKERIKETADSVLPDPHGPSARELVCDAVGRCKHRIAGAIAEGKEKVREIEVEAKEGAGKVKRIVSEKAHKVEEGAKEAARTTVDTGKTVGQQVARNISKAAKMAGEKVEAAREAVEDAVDTVKAGAHKFKAEAEKNISELLWWGRGAATVAVDSSVGIVQLVALAAAYGMCVWITFVSSHVLAAGLPRQQLAMVQSKIYAVYFKAVGYCVGVCLVGHLLGQRGRLFSHKAEMFQCYNLSVCLLMLVTNLMYLEPRATKAMLERMKIEKEEGRGRDAFVAAASSTAEPRPVTVTAATATTCGTKTTTATTPPSLPSAGILQQELTKSRMFRLNEKLKRLNTYSSFLNILTLMALTWNLVYLGQRLHLHGSF